MVPAVDRNSPQPYYLQIAAVLRARVASGEYAPGHPMPSEQEMTAEFGVTRATVRNALRQLRDARIIRTERGKGSVVEPQQVEQSLLRFYSFGRDLPQRGYDLRTHMLSLEEMELGPSDASLLGRRDCTAYTLERLRYLGERPFIFETISLPVDVVPGLALLAAADLERRRRGEGKTPADGSKLAPREFEASIYDLLENRYGVHVERAQESLSPRRAGVRAAELLDIREDEPVFVTERITRAVGRERPVELRRSVIRGDMITLSTELSL